MMACPMTSPKMFVFLSLITLSSASLAADLAPLFDVRAPPTGCPYVPERLPTALPDPLPQPLIDAFAAVKQFIDDSVNTTNVPSVVATLAFLHSL